MSADLLIGVIIVAFVQAVKFLSPKVTGLLTMVVAIAVGVLIGLLDKQIGLPDITVATGIWLALGAVGVHVLATSNTPPKA